MNKIIKKIYNREDTGTIYAIIGLQNAMNYHTSSIAPRYSELQKWEIAEYDTVNNLNVASFNTLREHMINNESVFNERLSAYNLTVTTFIALLINN